MPWTSGPSPCVAHILLSKATGWCDNLACIMALSLPNTSFLRESFSKHQCATHRRNKCQKQKCKKLSARHITSTTRSVPHLPRTKWVRSMPSKTGICLCMCEPAEQKSKQRPAMVVVATNMLKAFLEGACALQPCTVEEQEPHCSSAPKEAIVVIFLFH